MESLEIVHIRLLMVKTMDITYNRSLTCGSSSIRIEACSDVQEHMPHILRFLAGFIKSDNNLPEDEKIRIDQFDNNRNGLCLTLKGRGLTFKAVKKLQKFAAKFTDIKQG